MIFVITVILIIIYAYKYNQNYNLEYKIDYTHDAIKYQLNNINLETPLEIIIKGIYKKDHSTNHYIFKGDIIIDDEYFHGSGTDGNTYAFSKYNHTEIESESFRGTLFMNDMMSEITIQILEANNNGGYTFRDTDGWLISAPCNTRSEAISISNKLIRKLYKDINIK